MVDEDAHHRIGDQRRFRRLDQNAGVAGEAAVPVNAAEQQAEPDAGLEPEAIVHFDRLESRCRWCLPARGMIPAPSKPTLNLRGRP